MHQRSHYIIALSLGLLAIGVGDAGAQAWVQPAGGYFFKLTASYLDTDEEFNFKGERQPIFADDEVKSDARFQDFTLEAYLEYGITDRVTLIAKLPFKVLTASETESAGPSFPDLDKSVTNAGLSDLLASLNLQLFKKPLAASIRGGIKIPMGYEEVPDNLGPPLGTGRIDLEGQLNVGVSLWPLPIYASGGAGYRYRSGPLHDEIFFNVESGITLGVLFVKARVEGLRAVINPPDIAGATVTTPVAGGGGIDPRPSSVIVGDQDWLKFMPAVALRLGQSFHIMGEIYYVVSGRNTTAGTTVALGLVLTQ